MEVKIVHVGEIQPLFTNVVGIAKAYGMGRTTASKYVNEMKDLPQFKKHVKVLSNKLTLVNINGFDSYLDYVAKHYARGGEQDEK